MGHYITQMTAYDPMAGDKGNLDPCPFCGSDELHMWHDSDYNPSEFAIRCDVCRAIGPNEADERRAILRWNRRKKE